jgi:nucleoside-diphosphate-sugar epimerase
MSNGSTVDWKKLHGTAFQGARVLVTGGAGFIGSHLSEALATMGAKVVVLDDLSGGSESNLDGFGPVEFISGTILDEQTLKGAIQGCRFVFHQAALGSVPGSVAEPRKYHDANDRGTLNVLEAARAAGVKRVMFAASSSAYGDSPELPKVETLAPQALSPYAANKLACESLMSAYANSYGLDTVALRYFNIFGPRQNANSAYAAVIAAFASMMLAGKKPTIYGDGEQSRDFTYVANAVHANLLAARREQNLAGMVINVACGTRISVNQLASTMAEQLGRADLTPNYGPTRAGDVKHSIADLTRARTTLGYEPIVDFKTGLGATMAWYKKVLG